MCSDNHSFASILLTIKLHIYESIFKEAPVQNSVSYDICLANYEKLFKKVMYKLFIENIFTA